MLIEEVKKRSYTFANSKKNPSVLGVEIEKEEEEEYFNSDDFEEWPEEYRDTYVSLKVKDSKGKDIVYQGNKFMFTYGNRSGLLRKEYVIETLRSKIFNFNKEFNKEEEKLHKKSTYGTWFIVCEESYATGGGTHFHVFVFLSERKKKTLFQLQNHFRLTNEYVTAKPFVNKIEGKNWYTVVKYMLKEDKTPFCSLGSKVLLTWMNIISLEKGDEDLRKAVFEILDQYNFLRKEDIKSKEDLRVKAIEVTKTTPGSKDSKDSDVVNVVTLQLEDKRVAITRLEQESIFLTGLVPGSYHFASSNPLRIQYLEKLLKRHFELSFIGRISPCLTPSLVEIKETVAKADKYGVLTITGYPTNTWSDRQLIISFLTEIQRYQDKYDTVELMIFFCNDDMRLRQSILRLLGDSVVFIDENFKFLTDTDVMKPDVQINLNGGDVNNNYYGLEKKELSNLKKEIREEIKKELRQELIVEMTAKIKEEVKAKIKEELKEELKADLISFDKRLLS